MLRRYAIGGDREFESRGSLIIFYLFFWGGGGAVAKR